jgi:hypothetical protein
MDHDSQKLVEEVDFCWRMSLHQIWEKLEKQFPDQIGTPFSSEEPQETEQDFV